MADLTNNPSLQSMMSEFDRRLRNLEGAPQLGNSSIRRGGLNVYDESGLIAARFGELQAGLVSGAEFYDVVGTARLFAGRIDLTSDVTALHARTADDFLAFLLGRFEDTDGSVLNGLTIFTDFVNGRMLEITSENGIESPQLPLHARKADDAYTLTSASFVPTWRAQAEMWRTGYMKVEVVVNCAAGTSADVRIANTGSGYMSATSFVGAGTTTLTWRIALPFVTESHAIVVEARRTAGAGTVNVYDPIIQLGRGFGAYTSSGL